MKREEKIEKRKKRALIRRQKRNESYRSRVKAIREIGNMDIPLSAAKKRGGNNWSVSGASWADSSSPTGYSQICEYYGICQSPCNGDC